MLSMPCGCFPIRPCGILLKRGSIWVTLTAIQDLVIPLPMNADQSGCRQNLYGPRPLLPSTPVADLDTERPDQYRRRFPTPESSCVHLTRTRRNNAGSRRKGSNIGPRRNGDKSTSRSAPLVNSRGIPNPSIGATARMRTGAAMVGYTVPAVRARR
jgi:hypothetical protein